MMNDYDLGDRDENKVLFLAVAESGRVGGSNYFISRTLTKLSSQWEIVDRDWQYAGLGCQGTGGSEDDFVPNSMILRRTVYQLGKASWCEINGKRALRTRTLVSIRI